MTLHARRRQPLVRPTGQLTPVPPSPQYPPGFLSGSLLAGTLFAPIPVAD
jgi:hypothetical protein